MSYRKIQDAASGYELNREAGFWSVAVPEDTVNVIKNPGFEGATPLAALSTTGVGSSTATDTTWRAFGKSSVLVTLPSAGTMTFTQSNSEGVLTPLGSYTWSIYLKGQATKPLLLEVVHSLGSTVLASKSVVANGRVERQAITFIVPAGMTTGHNLLLRVTNSGGTTHIFNIDATQLEPKGYLTTYIDGDLTGGSWLGAPYASFSIRAPESAGGRIYDFKADFNYSVFGFQGAGMPPMDHQTTDQIYFGGKVVQRTLPTERVITLVGVLENRDYDVLLAQVDKLNQDLSPATGSQIQLPLKLKFTPYNGTTRLGQEVEATVLYAGGLELEVTNVNQIRYALMFEEFVPVGFTETVEQYQALNVRTTLAAAHAFVKRASGDWGKLPRAVIPASPITIRFAEDAYKAVYVASGNGTTFRVDKILYNPITNTESIVQSWTGFNGAITGIAFLPETGEPLVVGEFTSPQNYTAKLLAGGTIAAFFNPTGPAYAIFVDPAGYVWIGGNFNVGFAQKLVMLDYTGAVIQSLVIGNTVRAIAPGPKTGQVYVGGEFFSGPDEKVGFVDALAPGAPAYAAMNGGLTGGHVYALAVSPNGTLHAGGYFTTDGVIPVKPILRVAKFEAGRWLPVGNGLPAGGVTSLDFDSAGNLYASVTGGGSSATTTGFFVFDGIVWLPMEIQPGSGNTEGQLFITSDNRQIIGLDSLGSSSYFAGVTDVVNKGSAPAYPKIKVYGPTVSGNGQVKVHKITNFTTGASIYLEYSMSYSEILTLDFSPQNIQITSNLFGPVKAKLLSNSQFNRFFLASGRNGARVNRIVFFADMDLTSNALPSPEIYWRNTYWGVEGSVK